MSGVILKLLFSFLMIAGLMSCSVVKPYEREHLGDPIMESGDSYSKQTLEDKFFSTQEGSLGGESGVAGGCGCAK